MAQISPKAIRKTAMAISALEAATKLALRAIGNGAAMATTVDLASCLMTGTNYEPPLRIEFCNKAT